MAVYKVAQDVEADDKLIGPFSFRQFVYLIIVAMAMALAWGLSQIFIGFIIIPMPIILFFGALALPLRKDQPMEIYLAAIVSYYLKPRRRLWIPDGVESLVEITAPKVVEVQRAKDISQTEAERRLGYLADIADTQGWAIRHAAEPFVDNAMYTDAFFAARQTEDVLDDNGGIAQNLNTMITQADQRRRQEMMSLIQNPVPSAPQPAQSFVVPPIADPYAGLVTQTPLAAPVAAIDPSVQFNPYPTEIHQTVINPLGASGQLVQPHAQPEPALATPLVQPEPTNPEPTTSETTLSPDIINLASNTDLSIETIAREASRIQHRHDEDDGEEVIISLR